MNRVKMNRVKMNRVKMNRVKMNRANISFHGKKIYVGIDVHKKIYGVTVNYKGDVIKRDKQLKYLDWSLQF